MATVILRMTDGSTVTHEGVTNQAAHNVNMALFQNDHGQLRLCGALYDRERIADYTIQRDED
jgi:hypothetical protein